MSDAVTLANAQLRRGDARGALQILDRAQESGDALAARELAIWLLTGQFVRRDLSSSRAMFERSAALGDPASAAITRAFIAGGVGGPADWAKAIALLRAAAADDRAAADQLGLVEAMNLGPAGEPLDQPRFEILSDAPDVRLFPGLLSAVECRYLIDLAEPILRPSVVVDPTSGRDIPHPIRTSSAAGFPFTDENPALHALNRRLAAASGTDVRAGEPLQVLHYAPGEQYHEHSDALPGVAPNQQRVLTFLVYLNEDYEGGETAFPALGIKVRGRTGDGLLFRNAAADGTPDPRAIHAGLPVAAGVKHLASRWIRAAPLIVE